MTKPQIRLLAGVATLFLAGLLPGTGLHAQSQKPARGFIQFGARGVFDDSSSSKFREYRHFPNGFYVQRLDWTWDGSKLGTAFFQFQSRESLERDQSNVLSFGRHGKYRFDFRWEQSPHLFAGSAKFLFTPASPGVFSIPLATRTSLTATPSLAATLLAAQPTFDVALQRKKFTGSFQFTPTVNWRLLAQYAREHQQGNRPFSTTTNSFTHVMEFPEPIDYVTQAVTLSAEYARRGWGVQFAYRGSLFGNNVGELVWDIPFRTTDASNASSQGRLDLYPDNSAHTLSFAGAVNIGKSTRFTASIAPTWMYQNDTFLPMTINPAITGAPALPALSLNGKKQTLAMNYTLTSSVSRDLSFTTRFRSYDYNNHTASLVFSDYVRTDGGLFGRPRRSLPYGYDRKTFGFDVDWHFYNGHRLTFLYEWERLDREHRDVERSAEHTAGLALDVSPKKWLLFRTSFRHAWREPEHYEANEEGFPTGEGPFALGQIHELRKFDEAARRRERAEVMLQINPLESLGFSASFGTSQDKYHKSLYGLSHELNFNYNLDLTYSPRPEISFFAEYTREKFRYAERSRQRTPPSASGTPANDTTNNDWESYMGDLVDTWGSGLFGNGFDNRLDYEVFYSLSAAKGTIRTRALGSAAIPGFLVTSAQNYPDTNNRFHQMVSSVKFRVKENFVPKFEYRFEKYGQTDFQVNPMLPYMVSVDSSTSTSLFLGATVPGYKIHVVAFSLEYRF